MKTYPERYGDFSIKKSSNDHFWKWQKPLNVIDEFKQIEPASIKNIVKERSLSFSIMMGQIEGDFNFGSLVRSANFLGAKDIFYFGKKHWNRVGACGSYLYKDITFLSSMNDIALLKKQYHLVALENNIKYNVVPIHQFQYPSKNILFVIGEESCGISKEILEICDSFVEIVGLGSIRSLNAAVAGTIAMYDYYSKLQQGLIL